MTDITPHDATVYSPPNSGDEVVAHLEAARTPEEALEALGRSAHPRPRYGQSWSEILRQTARSPGAPGGWHVKDLRRSVAGPLTEWALSTVEHWVRMYQESPEPGSPARQAVWQDPRLLPALLVASEIESDSTHRGDRVLTAKLALSETGASTAYDSWVTFGSLTGEELDQTSLDWDPTSKVLPRLWRGVGAHPASTPHVVARALRALNSRSIRMLLDRPGLLATDPVQDALVSVLGHGTAVTGDVVGAASTTELRSLVAKAATADKYDLLGAFIRHATPQQRTALNPSEAEFATWCQRVRPEDRPHLMAVAPQVRPATRRRV